MYNPLIQLNRDRHDIFEALRQEIDSWLSKPNRTQSLLAKRAKISPQMLCDILGNRRGVSPETYDNLVKALKDPGTRIVSAQSNGQPVQGGTIDLQAARAEHELKRSEEIYKQNQARKGLEL